MKFIATNFKNILLLLAAVFIILLLHDCKGRKDHTAAIEKANRNLQQKHRQDSIDNENRCIVYEMKVREAQGQRQLKEVEKRETDKKVAIQQKEIDRLVAIVRNSNNNSNNSINSVSVTPEYKRACDSLPTEIDKLNAALVEKDSAINEWSSILAYEVQIRDEEIYWQGNYIDTLREDFNRQTALLRSSLQQGKPRGRLLGGVGLIGNEVNPLSGTKINLAYQSKGGKQYQGGAMIFKGGVYYEATVLITLIK